MENTVEIKPHTGAKIITETLIKLGIDKIFGYPGGVVLKIYDELFAQDNIQHILVRHEQAAVHAAEGYARVTGKPGVVLVTSGPGATNTITGIVNAYMDGFPLIVLTGQVSSELIGKNAFQEADICDMTKSCTKKVYQVTKTKDLQTTIIDAYKTAMSGKKGPVVIDIAKNVLSEAAEFSDNIEFSIPKPESSTDVSPILSAICAAKHPLIVAGGGSVNAYQELTAFAQMLHIPVVNTMMGTGIYPFDDKNYLGMIGIFGDNSANQALKQSDLIFSVGARFNDRITCCFNKNELDKKIIQLDINKDEISRSIPAYMSIVGDAKEILENMISEFNKGGYSTNFKFDTDNLKALNVKREKKSNMLHSFEVMEEVQKFISGKNIAVTTEVGQHQLWAVQNLKFNKPMQFITSGGSGTMGFGFPAAIGIAVANPAKPVICISGDGSFQMNMQELATCMDYNLPVKILILNNGYLGMVRQLQEKQCEKRYFETKISNPDFIKLAESYGAKGYRVNSRSEIIPTLEKAFESNGPALIEFIVEPLEVL